MTTGGSSPKLNALLQLAQQIESDRSVPLEQLRQRDHQLGERCRAESDSDRLLYWLQNVGAESVAGQGARSEPEHSLSEGVLLVAMRLLSVVFGALSMAGFLLASGRGLVNVFVFIALFVLVQLLLCGVSAIVLMLAARGKAPAASSLNPLRWLVPRVAAANAVKGALLARTLRDFPTLMRLLLLRYGQEMGALFTLGAVGAFFVVLGFSDFTFVWGSTFNISDELLSSAIELMARPWSPWLAAAVPTPDVIEASRYHPTLTDLGRADIASMRQWWPFLITAMLAYALLPRIVLWLASRQLYHVQLRQAFIAYPGAKLILARMKAPVVKTQAPAQEPLSVTQKAQIGRDKGLMLVDWAGAMNTNTADRFDGLAAVPLENVQCAGLNSLLDDEQCRRAIEEYRPQQLLVAVKSWEPPMLDLADFLKGFVERPPCTLSLVPLPGKEVSEHQLQEWRIFAQETSLDALDVSALRWTDVAAETGEVPACTT